MPLLREFGPFDDCFAAMDAAGAAGFAVPTNTKTLFVHVEDDGFRDEERPTVWISKGAQQAVVVVELDVIGEDRRFPGSLSFGDVLEFEKQWAWPTWTDQTWLVSPPISRSGGRFSDDELLEAFSRQGGIQLTLRQEMLGIGRSGGAIVVVHSPIPMPLLSAAKQLIAKTAGRAGQ